MYSIYTVMTLRSIICDVQPTTFTVFVVDGGGVGSRSRAICLVGFLVNVQVPHLHGPASVHGCLGGDGGLRHNDKTYQGACCINCSDAA